MPRTREAIQEGKYEPATVMSGPGRQPESSTPAVAVKVPRSPCESAVLIALSVATARRRGRNLTRAERKGHRGIEELDLRLHLLEVRAAQLSTRAEEIDEGAELQAIGAEDGLVGALRGLDEGAGHVEPPEAQPYVRVCLPDLADGLIASRRELLLGGSPLGLRQLHLALARSALEELPLQAQPCPVPGFRHVAVVTAAARRAEHCPRYL